MHGLLDWNFDRCDSTSTKHILVKTLSCHKAISGVLFIFLQSVANE